MLLTSNEIKSKWGTPLVSKDYQLMLNEIWFILRCYILMTVFDDMLFFDRKHLPGGRMNKNNNLIFNQKFAWAHEISKDNLDSTLKSQFSLFLDIVSEARGHVSIILRSFF